MRCLRHLCLAFSLVATLSLAAEPKTVLLVGQSPDDHPPGTHEYMTGIERLAKLLESTAGLTVRVLEADEPWSEGPRLVQSADGVVLFLSEGARWIQAEPRRHEAFARLAARGGGLVALHWALGTRDTEPIEAYLKLFGGCHGGPDRKYEVIETDLHVVDAAHPVTRGLADFRVRDELYYRLKFAQPPASVRPLLEATIGGRAETVAWAYQRADGGRSFGFSGLHFDDNWQRDEYRQLLTRAVHWTLELPNP